MFGGDMMGKLQEMQKAAEENKKRLDDVIVEGKSPNGEVQVSLTANRNFKSININLALNEIDKEDLEDFIAVAFTRALEEANKVNDQEMMNSAKSFLPGF